MKCEGFTQITDLMDYLDNNRIIAHYCGFNIMNTLVIVLIAAVCLFGAYVLYGRWLANKWGIDPAAKTPAVVHEDGRDYVPTNGWTVFAHQFSSIAGAGPVTGAIQAAAFGWLPVLRWLR